MAPFDGTQLDTQFKTELIVKPDVFSLEGLIAWLETQDPETTYAFSLAQSCLVALYVEGVGGKFQRDALDPEYVVGNRRLSAWTHDMGRLIDVAVDVPWTFGAALDRARKLAARGAL